jgi:hypothetical protein
MKMLLLLALFLTIPTFAHAQHQVTLNWVASTDSTAATPGTVTVYRAAAACPASGIGTLTYTALSTTAPAGGPYTDTAVTSGSTYCYYVTATIGGATSGPSNTVSGTIPVGAPSSLILVVK